MTSKADFTPQEWELVLEAPPSAGIVVITAQHGGTLRESVSMAKAYAEARQHHGQSELLDEIVAAQELDEYKHFILNLADKVAGAHRAGRRDEEPVSDAERAAIAAIAEALGAMPA